MRRDEAEGKTGIGAAPATSVDAGADEQAEAEQPTGIRRLFPHAGKPLDTAPDTKGPGADAPPEPEAHGAAEADEGAATRSPTETATATRDPATVREATVREATDTAPPRESDVSEPRSGPARHDARPQARDPEALKLTPDMRVEQTETARTREEPRTAGTTIDIAPNRPIRARSGGGGTGGGGSSGNNGGGGRFHQRVGPEDFGAALRAGIGAIRHNLVFVMLMSCATNILILAIPVYLFQISDRVLTSRSTDTLIMLTVIIAAAVILQATFDAIRRFMLMRTAVEVAAQLGAPTLSAAAAASLHGTGREYQTLGDLQQLRGFLVSGTLISFLDVPFAPLFIMAIFLIHPHLGSIVVVTSLLLLTIALINQRVTADPFAEANMSQARANMHLDAMSRNSQIINALAMIPEAVKMWGRDTAASLKSQVKAQDRNIIFAAISRAVRLLTQIAMLGWGAWLAIDGQITGGMVIAASIIAGRALAPIEGSIEGWNTYLLTRSAYGRIERLLKSSTLQFEKLRLPKPEGRLDVERLLYVPAGTKQVVLNGISFRLQPGETLAVIGNSGAGKTTLGKMLVGSILPTSGSVRLDLMDLRNWDPRQFGESIGYLPQDVQLFPGTIKQNIARMREEATDAEIHDAAVLADVHEMIATLPQGYETVVAADGSPLSGGQKQRIALARAFYGNPRLLVLDEPNSNLDTAGDKALARAIEHAKTNGITVVVITQKPALLSVVDRIMLLNDGAIGLFGSREDVLARLQESKQSRRGNGNKDGGTPANA